MPRSFAKTATNAAIPAMRQTRSVKVTSASNELQYSGKIRCPIKFICVPRPFWDFELEHKSEIDYEDENEDVGSPWGRKWTETLKEARKTWLKPAADFPDYTWVVGWTYH